MRLRGCLGAPRSTRGLNGEDKEESITDSLALVLEPFCSHPA